ncbi:MAG: transposase [Tepidisphaeraceae bacterium]|jgi:transposase
MTDANKITDGITDGIEARKQRGLQIAAKAKISKRDDGSWTVPSQTGKCRYAVSVGQRPHCTCQDHEIRACKCKHIYAVEFVIERESNSDGTETITQSLTVTESVTRPTYSQDWPAYNAAQTNEKAQFQILMHQLCRNVPEPEYKGNGRPRLPIADAIFAAAFKVFSTVSGRRFISDLCDAQVKGYISKVPHFNSIFNYLEMPSVTPILQSMIEQSTLPLRSVESDFAVDATGFASTRFARWFNFKYCEEKIAKEWIKLHLVCGVKTNIVTGVEVTGRFEHDSPYLPGLVEKTAKNFAVREISADKGYHSRDNYNAIVAAGAAPYIPFKTTSKLDVDTSNRGCKIDHSTLWSKMYHLYHFKRDEFLPHYHKRSNVESTFMSIKAKFGDAVRSKTPVAQTNEVLCKVLCHNVCVNIQSMYELGIQPDFGLVA